MTTFNVEETQNLGTSAPSVVSNVTRAPRRNRSNVWNHFTPDPDLSGIAICDYCTAKLKSSNGTTSMAAHTNNCKSNPNNNKADKRLKTTSLTTYVTSPSTIVAERFDQQKCRDVVVAMVVEMELPFRHVDHKAFRCCMNVFQPRWTPISRHTVARDVLSLWERERTKLKSFLSQHCQSMCLTTDGWTSCQNKSMLRRLLIGNLHFLGCAKTVQIEYKGSVILDVETRWNSTHDMLKAALKLEKTFDEVDDTDSKYRKELEKKHGVPTFLDWEKAHPRQKLVYLNWFIERNFVKLEADALKEKLDLNLKAIFEEYNNSVGGGVGGSQGESEPTTSVGQIGNPNYYYGKFLQSTGVVNSSGFKSELIKYFNDGLEEDSPNFDILNYWKLEAKQSSEAQRGSECLQEFRSSEKFRSSKMFRCLQEFRSYLLVMSYSEDEDIQKLEYEGLLEANNLRPIRFQVIKGSSEAKEFP
ncbi:hypothetical protein TSUD_400180 [Trifolium subterraneum]|uniref:BED-type domain-containing protein n=1 Tax=Trifolium subterraneum TaxID=3900 RepID=A0A2Z6NJI0_TRISU|nr:hypothetical protein TSUD_400180 [Trifolium subterraneum]